MEVKVPLDIKPGELRCPRCFHRDIVPSLPRGLKDEFMRARGRIPRHCRSCGKRFYVRASEVENEGDSAEAEAPKKQVAAG